MMLIKSHIEGFGFKNWEDISIYSLSDNGLNELVSNSDACELIAVDNLPIVIEIWVVTMKVIGDENETK
ncbi:hypothetical protein DM860_015374 [Cuscuta australis]|uniref:Uncharacterized protein n=1 Tax=Cuscuta australis TaxID=267555 RepID=A0A328DQ47_9ASTE|nr:hypothetical protein DM860_015374 [Cuscuta australis]